MKYATTTLILLSLLISILGKDIWFDKNLSGWIRSKKGEVSKDAKVRKSDFSIRLKNNASISRKMDLEPDTRYLITFYIKGHEIASTQDNNGMLLLLNGGKNWQRIAANPKNLPETGTFDWKKATGIVDTSKYKTGKITFLFRIKGEGTAWIDELNIEKITSDFPASEGKLAFDNNLTGWDIPSKGIISVDSNTKKSDLSIRLDNKSMISRSLQLDPDTQYKLSFYIKGKDIATEGNSGAGVLLNAGKTWMRITSQPGNKYENGTFDWKKVTGIIDTGKFKSGNIRLYLSLNCSGIVWFDDLQIEKK